MTRNFIFLEGEYTNTSKLPKREITRTKSVYDPVEESDGVRVLIMRKWPRGIGYRKNNKRGMIDFWCKELSLSIDLLDNWNGKKITWPQYVKRYRAEQKNSAAAKKETEFLTGQSIDKTITLLCKERENDPHCHRHILKKIIDQKYERMIKVSGMYKFRRA